MKTKTYLIDMTEEERIQRRKESARKYHQSDKYKQWRDEHRTKVNEYALNYYYKHRDEPEFVEKYAVKNKKYNENQKQPCVYMYREIESGKIAYIGSTNYIQKRISTRKRSNSPFDRKYQQNPDKFELFIIGKYESIDIAREEEVKYIQKLKPLYNIAHNH